ncbi:hypothetical protein A3721_17850 [Sulfitobacter sp. HI0023]|nr:hypothetical protein A3721_17850 [Sulfitobacter sp. HI0023]
MTGPMMTDLGLSTTAASARFAATGVAPSSADRGASAGAADFGVFADAAALAADAAVFDLVRGLGVDFADVLMLCLA